MATKKATRRSRTKLPKKSSPKKRVVEHAAPEPPARSLELEDWLNEVRDVAEQASSTGHQRVLAWSLIREPAAMTASGPTK